MVCVKYLKNENAFLLSVYIMQKNIFNRILRYVKYNRVSKNADND